MNGWPCGLLLAGLLLTGAAQGQAPAPPASPATPERDRGELTVAEVLSASAAHFPQVLQGLAARRGAEGKVLEADGAFDLVFEAEGSSRIDGFYDGSVVEGYARQPLRPLGAEIYGGYQLSDGTFPVYEDEYYTNTGGALKVGVLFSLLRDRVIDERRFGQEDARLALQQAELDVLLTRIGVQQRALLAYWNWVKVGAQLAVYRDLLRIAIERQQGLEEQVRKGARAEIFLTENRQNITRRQRLVTAAERDLRLAANRLSFYYRDADGRPVVPEERRLPRSGPLDPVDDVPAVPEMAASEALQRRPEIAVLRAAIERERNRIALAENELRPRLDFGMEVKQPFGSVAEGGESRDETDTVIGFEFTVPLQRRAAQGKLAQAEAELESRQFEQRLAEERIELEVRNILLELNYARELLVLASQEVRQSVIMRNAEVRRFESGASDFFLVNVREETAADARIRLFEAELEARIARANYDAATVDLDRLGLAGVAGDG